MIQIRRRFFLSGLASVVGILAAPAIVRASTGVMPIKPPIIVPGNLLLKGYRTNPAMAYEWVATELRDEPPEQIIAVTALSGWLPSDARIVGGEVWLEGARLIERPLSYHQQMVAEDAADTEQAIEGQRAAVMDQFAAMLPAGIVSLGGELFVSSKRERSPYVSSIMSSLMWNADKWAKPA